MIGPLATVFYVHEFEAHALNLRLRGTLKYVLSVLNQTVSPALMPYASWELRQLEDITHHHHIVIITRKSTITALSGHQPTISSGSSAYNLGPNIRHTRDNGSDNLANSIYTHPWCLIRLEVIASGTGYSTSNLNLSGTGEKSSRSSLMIPPPVGTGTARRAHKGVQ